MQGPHFLWWDNFSKNIARYCPSIARGVYTSCLWTGSAVFAGAEHEVLDHRVRRNNANEVIPAMPDNLLEHQPSVMRGLQRVFGQGRSRYAESLVYKHQVNLVPLKIISADDQKNQHGSEGHSMNVVFPERIMPQNIGSNLGLISLLKAELHDKHGMGTNECKNYVNLNVDENIFYRILKVIACVVLVPFPTCCHILCNIADIGDVRPVRSRLQPPQVHGCVTSLVAQLQVGNCQDHGSVRQGLHWTDVPSTVSNQGICPHQDEATRYDNVSVLHPTRLPQFPSTTS